MQEVGQPERVWIPDRERTFEPPVTLEHRIDLFNAIRKYREVEAVSLRHSETDELVVLELLPDGARVIYEKDESQRELVMAGMDLTDVASGLAPEDAIVRRVLKTLRQGRQE
jgi:hypothetical protein